MHLGSMKRTLRFTVLGLLVALPVSAGAPYDQYGSFTGEDEQITDNFTKLVWVRDVSPIGTFATAKLACGAGTRLPSMKELLTIVDEEPHLEYENNRVVPKMIDPSAFPDTPGSLFWTSSVDPDDSNKVWTVNFRDGTASATEVTTTQAYVRCVSN
jgi:hypothetical protein